MRVTRKDVSLRSGVSTSTVGMILNGRGQAYTEETRRKVMQAADDLNYRPHISARGLRMSRSLLIGLSVFDSNAALMTRITRGVQRALAVTEYSALVFSHSSREQELEWHRRCTERQVDGMIINPGLAIDGSAETKTAYLNSIGRNVPVVEILGQAVAEVPNVNVDEVGAGRAATEYLLSLGHRRIVMLTHEHFRAASGNGPGRHADAWRRFTGYQQAMLAAGSEPVAITHAITGEIDVEPDFFNGGMQSLDLILNHPAKPTAVVCYNDLEAYGLLRAASQKGVDVPGQLSIIGNGDASFSVLVEPGLTTFSVPAEQVGQRAAESLLALIEKQPVQDLLLLPNLIIRGSTASIG